MTRICYGGGEQLPGLAAGGASAGIRPLAEAARPATHWGRGGREDHPARSSICGQAAAFAERFSKRFACAGVLAVGPELAGAPYRA